MSLLCLWHDMTHYVPIGHENFLILLINSEYQENISSVKIPTTSVLLIWMNYPQENVSKKKTTEPFKKFANANKDINMRLLATSDYFYYQLH